MSIETETSSPKHEPPQNTLTKEQVKVQLNALNKLYEKIQNQNAEEESTSFLTQLPDPYDYIANGEVWKEEWKKYVDNQANKFNSRFPDEKEKYVKYHQMMDKYERRPMEEPRPADPEFSDEFKQELTKLRVFFHCMEMAYMQTLAQLYKEIKLELPELLEEGSDEEVDSDEEEESTDTTESIE